MISTFGIVLAVSYLLGVFLFWRKGRGEGFSSDDLFDLALVSSLAAIAGGKLPPLFLATPGGFFWSGSVLAGAMALIVFASFKRWSPPRILDLAALAMSFSEALISLWLGITNLQPFPLAAGYLLRVAFLNFIYRRTPPGVAFFLYLLLESVLLYFSQGFISWALIGGGVAGLAALLGRKYWIAIRSRFKVKRSNG